MVGESAQAVAALEQFAGVAIELRRHGRFVGAGGRRRQHVEKRGDRVEKRRAAVVPELEPQIACGQQRGPQPLAPAVGLVGRHRHGRDDQAVEMHLEHLERLLRGGALQRAAEGGDAFVERVAFRGQAADRGRVEWHGVRQDSGRVLVFQT